MNTLSRPLLPFLAALLICGALSLPALADGAPPAAAEAPDEEWIAMPETARPAYAGIHGGTAPVTIYATPEGDLLPLPGASGKDFLHLLRSGKNASGLFSPKDAPVDWEAFSPPRVPTPAGLAPLSPQEWLLAESRRLDYAAARRARQMEALLAIMPLQKIYPPLPRPDFPRRGPLEPLFLRLRRSLGHDS